MRDCASAVLGMVLVIDEQVLGINIPLDNPLDSLHRQRFKGVKNASETTSRCDWEWVVCSRLSERQKVLRLGISGPVWLLLSAEVAPHLCVWTWFRAMDPQGSKAEKDRLDLLRKEGQDPRAVKANARRAVEN